MEKCILPAIFFLLKRILNILLFNTSKIQQAFIKNTVHFKTYEKMNDVCLESCMFKNVKCRRNKINHTLVLLSKISFPVKRMQNQNYGRFKTRSFSGSQTRFAIIYLFWLF